MFDRTVISMPSSPSMARVVVHEHKAPTDASVKLLTEMEAAARDRLLASYELANNHFEATIHVFSDDLSAQRRVTCLYKMNGTRFRTEFTVKEYDVDPETLLPRIHAELAADIARIVLAPHLRQIYGRGIP